MNVDKTKTALILAAPLFLMAAAALGGDGVDVTVTNDSTDDLFVTVYDHSIGTDTVVLSHARINGFTSIPVSVAPDASGHANISWTAVSADSENRRCGHQESVQLSDASSLTVHADASCNTST